MIVALAWLALALTAGAIEVVARRTTRIARLGDIGRVLTDRPVGRLALLVCWAFVGWHLFARATVPPL